MAGVAEDQDLEDQGSGDTTLGKRPRDEAASDNSMDCSHPTNWCVCVCEYLCVSTITDLVGPLFRLASFPDPPLLSL